MKIRILFVVVIIIIFILLVPFTALADGQFQPNTSGTLYTTVKDGAGNPVNNATVSVTLWASNGTAIFSGQNMTYLTGSYGKYYYTFTTPSVEGDYIAESYAVGYGYGSETVHIIAAGNISYTYTGNFTYTGSNASEIWGENLTGYDDPLTFGGIFNLLFGGDSMLIGILGILIVLGVIFLAIYLWKREMWLGIAAGTIWSALAIYVLAIHTADTPELATMWDGLGWLFLAIGLALLLAPLTWNKTKDEIWEEAIDEDTGDPIMEQYTKGNRTGRTRGLSDLELKAREERIAASKFENKPAGGKSTGFHESGKI